MSGVRCIYFLFFSSYFFGEEEKKITEIGMFVYELQERAWNVHLQCDEYNGNLEQSVSLLNVLFSANGGKICI